MAFILRKLVTDHQPLTALFCPESNISATAASWLQHLTSRVSFRVISHTIERHNMLMWRLPIPHEEMDKDTEEVNDEANGLTSSYSKVSKEVKGRDTLLSKVFTHFQSGWPKTVEDMLQVCFDKCHELTTEQGCLMWRTRVVIPKVHQQKVQEELHGGHLGVDKMGVASSN